MLFFLYFKRIFVWYRFIYVWFIIMLYHSGASFKDLGNKCFAINRIESKEMLENLLSKIKNEVNLH